MKFYVRKKIGDMHVTGGGGGGGGEFYRSLHGPKSKLLVLCLLQKALCMWGTLRNNSRMLDMTLVLRTFSSLSFQFFFLVSSSSLSYPSHLEAIVFTLYVAVCEYEYSLFQP